MQAGQIWSLLGNPAGLATIRMVTLGTDIEQRFLLRELSFGMVGAALPAFDGSFAFLMRRRGMLGYHETDLAAGYGRGFGGKLDAGLSLQYQLVAVSGEYENTHSLAYRLGFIIRINEMMQAGFSARNPFSPVFKTSSSPPLFQFGFIYKPGPEISILGGIDKEISRNIRFKVGCEIERKDRFRAAIGMISSPGAITFGAGVRLGGLCIDIAGVIHQFLGYYPQCSLEYQFRSR